jgi:hypothetical protein
MDVVFGAENNKSISVNAIFETAPVFRWDSFNTIFESTPLLSRTLFEFEE